MEEYVISLLVILGILLVIVIYQSRHDKPAVKVYLQRFVKLLLLIFNYFKEVGVCAGKSFREINWDLTKVHPSIQIQTEPQPSLDPNLADIRVPELDEPTVESFKSYRTRKMKHSGQNAIPEPYNM